VSESEFRPGPFPIALGHESVGRVVRVGDRVRNYRIGDRVLRTILYDRHVPEGCSRWGGMSEYGLVVDAAAVREDGTQFEVHRFAPKQQIVPLSITPAQAVAMITLKEALHFLKAFSIGDGQPLAIVGTGPVGQALSFLGKALGASPVVVFGRREVHSGCFKELGADAYVVGNDYPVLVKDVLACGRFPRAIEAVGSREALKRCLEVASGSGQVCVYGIAPVSNGWDEQDLKDPRICQMTAKEEEVHGEMIEMVATGHIDLNDWVDQVLPAERCERAFDLVRSTPTGKIVLTF
jgi:threonine dehydrogenase-like Zn-dependent dehydrogenase